MAAKYTIRYKLLVFPDREFVRGKRVLSKKQTLLALIKVMMITMVQIMMMVRRKMYYLKKPGACPSV